MNYKEVTEFLYRQLPMFQRKGKAAYKANLNNTILLDDYFGNPHKKFRSIHVAGTNGKGSVSHMLAAILQSAGYKTGLYTSPHLKSYRERIRINGKMIPEVEITNFVNSNKKIIAEINPSFFEITVIMAFNYFAEQNVDVAIIEVGLGGRLDSTNIITPLLSIITNIGFDHTEFLGNSLKSIAIEKAGIIKPGIPVVIGQTQKEISDLFITKTTENNSPIYFADRIYSSAYSMIDINRNQVFNIKKANKIVYDNLKLDLNGNYQKYNLLTVLQSIAILQKEFKINTEDIYNGLENTTKLSGIQGRWQNIGNNPLIIADTGHNFDGISEVVKQLKNTAFKNLHIVIGMVNDKNIDTILKLLPLEATYYFTKANIPRALDENILLTKAKTIGLKGKSYPYVKLALRTAKENANKNDLIFVGGSTFIVAEAIP